MKPNLTEKRTRTLDRDGRRLGIRLEPEAWAAIDLVAGKRGMSWQTWATGVLDASPDAPNATAVLRMAAMERLVEGFTAPAYDPGFDVDHPLMNNVVAVDRALLQEELANSDVLYSATFGGFVLHAVNRRDGGPALLIENLMIDQLSVIYCEDH